MGDRAMRELKVRIWQDRKKEMGAAMSMMEVVRLPRIKSLLNTAEIIQGTGVMLDGKEIYEGDIIVYTDEYYDERLAVVTYSGSGFKFDHILVENVKNWPEVTVVGNVYENPELLEECSFLTGAHI